MPRTKPAPGKRLRAKATAKVLLAEVVHRAFDLETPLPTPATSLRPCG